MPKELAASISHSAAKLVALCKERDTGAKLDFSRSSLAVVKEMAGEAAKWAAELTPDEITAFVQDFGCYLLDTGRREFGGRYLWHEARGQPVLVVGEPVFHVAIMTWDKVRGRLGGDPADNLPFFYDGFAERARQATPGTHALYV